MLALAFLFGIISLWKIPRNVFPLVNFDLISISTSLPGASPEQVEKLLLNPIEIALNGIDGIKQIKASAVENFTVVVIEIDPDSNTERVKQDVRNTIEAINDFPKEATEPIINEIDAETNQPFLELSLEMPERNDKLFELSHFAKEELEKVKDIRSVKKVGYRNPEIYVLVDSLKLWNQNISLTQINQAIQSQNISLPAGKALDKRNTEILVRTQGEYESESNKGRDVQRTLLSSVKNTIIRSNDAGYAVSLKDVAHVSMGRKKATQLNRSNGNPAIDFVISKKLRSDAITVAENVKKKIIDLKDKIGEGRISIFRDLSFYIKRRLKILEQNFFLGLILILLLLSLVLPWQVSTVVAAGIPIAILGSITIAYLIGFTLNLISVLGLIIVLGVIVDDAIVIGENIWKKVEENMPIEKAALKGTEEMLSPVTASVMTTILAFVPMLFMSGIMGKFVFEIPLMVIICLVLSLAEVFFLMPSHFVSWLSPFLKDVHIKMKERKRTSKREKFFENFSAIYERWVSWTVRKKYISLGILCLFFTLTGLIVSWKGRFVLFPSGGDEVFYVSIETPSGTPLKETERHVFSIEKEILKLKNTNELESIKTSVGKLCSRNFHQSNRGDEYACIRVNLVQKQERNRNRKVIEDQLREKIKLMKGFTKVTVESAREGPPQGSDISIEILGKDFTVLKEISDRILKKIITMPGTVDVRSSFSSTKEEWRIIPDKRKMAINGLTATQIATTVRASLDGLTPTSLRNLEEEIDIRVKLKRNGAVDTLPWLKSLKIGNSLGNMISLNSVATFEKQQTIRSITHLNGKRSINISGSIDENTIVKGKKLTPLSFIQQISPFIDKVLKEKSNEGKYGYEVSYSGESQDTQESMKTLMSSFIFAFIGIFFLLVLTFHNFIQPFLILMSVPLGLAGVAWALIFHGKPLSFMSGMGVIALSGVIVNNAIMLIDFVNSGRKKGLSLEDSIISAAKRRLRPILLTTLTTVVGLMPTIYGEAIVALTGGVFGGYDPFIVPLALALGWGLAIGVCLTVTFFPPLIAIVDDLRFYSKTFFKKIFYFIRKHILK